MKNKIFLSLAMLVAANAFIATPAMAINWSLVNTTAKIAGKAALGITAFGTSALLPFLFGAEVSKRLIVKESKLEPSVEDLLSRATRTPVAKTVSAIVLTTSVVSSVIGYTALKSALNDFKSITK
jgi:hypothetical protein